MLHDLLDYHARYLDFFHYNQKVSGTELGFAWMDFKGHGLSSGVRGHVQGFDEYCYDVEVMIDHLKNEGIEKVLFIGQGLGALVMLKMMNPLSPFSQKMQESSAGLVFINPLIHFNFQWPDFNMGRLKKWVPTLDRWKISLRLKGHHLCTDLFKADELDRDPLFLEKVSLGFIHEVLKAGVDVRRMSYFIDTPSLFLVSRDDFLLSFDQIILYQKGLPREIASLQEYSDAKHDLLNDKNRELVFNDILSWISTLELS
jgi:alpha-beta hydrolase superfamily lysophospholipase